MATFTNQALLTYNGGSTVSNTVTGELMGALTVTKSALDPTYTPGGSITYIVTLVNSGMTALEGVTLSDDLGAYEAEGSALVPLDYDGDVALLINGIPQADPAVTAEDGLEVSGIDIPALGSAVLIYKVRVNDRAPLGAGDSIVNTVSVTGDQLSAPVTASAEATPSSLPVLSITKSMSPTTVMENGVLTYTFEIENRGNTEADEDAQIVVTDLFSPTLSEIAVALNGQALSSPADFTYDEAAGEFRTTAGTITVPAASYGRADDGSVTIVPGTAVLTVTGTV